jgi:hypothetical protein
MMMNFWRIREILGAYFSLFHEKSAKMPWIGCRKTGHSC